MARCASHGEDITKASPDRIVRAGLAQVPQGRGTFVDLSVDDNLRVGGYTRRDDASSDLDRWYETFPRLAERRTQKAGSLSGGEQQMLAIARALMSRPKLLLCDEPSLGLAPLIVQELFGILAQLNKEEGLSVLLVEQNANLAMEIADRAYLLGDRSHRGFRRRRLHPQRRRHPSGLPRLLGDDRPVERFLQYFFDGLSQGSIYAFVALGLVIIYRGSGHLNFAQGEMAMFSAFVAWWLADNGVGLWPAVLLSAVIAFVAAMGVERLIIRPIAHKSPFAVVVAAIGLFLGFNALAPFIWKVHDPRGLRLPVPRTPPTTSCASVARSGGTRTSACSPCWP